MTRTLDPIVCLIENLSDCESLNTLMKPIYTKYRIVNTSVNEEKKQSMLASITAILQPIYETHRHDILDKDFSWIKDEMIKIDDVDIGSAYMIVMSEGTDDMVKRVNNALLFLFHAIMDDNDKAIVSRKFKKAKKPKESKSVVSTTQSLEKLMEVYGPELQAAGNNPHKREAVMKRMFEDKGGMMAGMITNLMNGLGLK